MKKVFCLFLSMFILLNVVNTDILRINSSAENDMLEYSTVEVITNNIAENDISNEVGEGSQTGVDMAIPTENKTKLIKKNDKIYMLLEDICKFTRTTIEKTDNKYILKQGRLEITVLIKANGNSIIKSLYGEFNTNTISDNDKIYCEPEPLMSMLFADCTYYDNILLIYMPQYTIHEAIDFDYFKYKSDITDLGIDNTDNMITGFVKWGLATQRLYVSFATDIIVDCNYGFFATDNTTKQYYNEAFNEVLGYNIYSNETVNEEETKKYENQKELSSFLEKTQNGDISDTPFTDFYISSYIRSYAKTGLKDSSSLSMFNDTIRDLSTNGRVNEKINSFLNQSGSDVITNVLFNSILEYIKRSSYDRKVLQMFKTLYSDETVNKYNISLSENDKFFFQCAKDYYNSCGSFDNIVKEVTLNESINKFSEIMLKGAFYLSTGGKSQEVFETYETILSAEKLRESNSSFKPIEKINNSAKYFWLAKMQESTLVTYKKISEKFNESLNREDMENIVSNLDFYNRVSAVMIKTLADSYQLPTATEREKDLMAHSDEYIKDLAINTYKLECCEYNLPTKEELNNKNYDVFKKFFSNQEGETTETTTETTSTTTETTITTTETTTTTTVTTPTYEGNIIDSGNCGADVYNVKWELYENGTLRIYGTGDMETYFYSTTSPFKNDDRISNIIIEKGVTNIGGSIFAECTNLKSVIIPDSVTSIGLCAFEKCKNLKSITIPGNVDFIEMEAFSKCTNLEAVTILNGVKEIGERVFYNCISLTSITIPDSVTRIRESAFYNCISLTSIIIPNSITSIGESAFSYCENLKSITIPDGSIAIYQFEFYNCTSLSSVTIPSSVTRINDYAFSNCTSLTSITIPDSVTHIGSSVFSENLTDVYYTGTEEQWKQIEIGYFNDSLIKATIHYNSIS